MYKIGAILKRSNAQIDPFIKMYIKLVYKIIGLIQFNLFKLFHNNFGLIINSQQEWFNKLKQIYQKKVKLKKFSLT